MVSFCVIIEHGSVKKFNRRINTSFSMLFLKNLYMLVLFFNYAILLYILYTCYTNFLCDSVNKSQLK